MTLDAFRRGALKLLSGYYGPDEAQALVRRWLSARLLAQPHELLLRRHEPLTPEMQAQLGVDFELLKQHTPVQYVLGWQHFCGMQLAVGPGVLIPRPETEELVLRTVQMMKRPPTCVIDVGTGSGAIALALKQAWPQTSVMGIDISEEALAYARRNAAELGLEVSWHLQDVAQWAQWPAWQPELIINNPPYIPPAEASNLGAHVRLYEPPQALFTPTEDATGPYRLIADYAQAHLQPGGWVALELHSDTAHTVAALFHQDLWDHNGPVPDTYGRLRYLWACKRAII